MMKCNKLENGASKTLLKNMLERLGPAPHAVYPERTKDTALRLGVKFVRNLSQ